MNEFPEETADLWFPDLVPDKPLPAKPFDRRKEARLLQRIRDRIAAHVGQTWVTHAEDLEPRPLLHDEGTPPQISIARKEVIGSVRRNLSITPEPLESRVMLRACGESPKQVIGFLPGYLQGRGFDNSIYDAIGSGPFIGLTHLNFFSLVSNPDGTVASLTDGIQPNVPDPADLHPMVSLAHEQHVAVSIIVSGADSGEFFQHICGAPALRITLVTNLVQFALTHNFHGIDLDFEEPMTETDVANYGVLIGQLHDARSPLGLTLSYSDHHYVPASVLPDIDTIEVMAYNGPLGGPPSYPGALSFWTNYGALPRELVLGIPFFGLSSSSYDQELGYGAIQHQCLRSYVQFLTPRQDAAVLHGTEYAFSAIDTVKQKTRYAFQNGYAGIMVFELTHDCFTSGRIDEVSLPPAIRNMLTFASDLSLASPRSLQRVTIKSDPKFSESVKRLRTAVNDSELDNLVKDELSSTLDCVEELAAGEQTEKLRVEIQEKLATVLSMITMNEKLAAIGVPLVESIKQLFPK